MTSPRKPADQLPITQPCVVLSSPPSGPSETDRPSFPGLKSAAPVKPTGPVRLAARTRPLGDEHGLVVGILLGRRFANAIPTDDSAVSAELDAACLGLQHEDVCEKQERDERRLTKPEGSWQPAAKADRVAGVPGPLARTAPGRTPHTIRTLCANAKIPGGARPLPGLGQPRAPRQPASDSSRVSWVTARGWCSPALLNWGRVGVRVALPLGRLPVQIPATSAARTRKRRRAVRPSAASACRRP